MLRLEVTRHRFSKELLDVPGCGINHRQAAPSKNGFGYPPARDQSAGHAGHVPKNAPEQTSTGRFGGYVQLFHPGLCVVGGETGGDFPPVPADDGDRDGLPNVLMEAQSQALACVATRVSAIPELIIHGKTGILVPPDDANALSHALSDLIKAPIQRQTLGQTGEQRVRQSFSLDGGIDDLARRFGLTC